MNSWRHGIIALLCLLPGAMAAAADPPPTRAQTLHQDLSGPRVDLQGSIAGRLQDGDDTCFVLQVAGGGWSGLQEGRLLACNPGPFDVARFGVGQPLRVTGTLGAAMPRLVGGSVVSYPVVAGAFVYPGTPPGYYDYGPYYYGPGYSYYPYASPFSYGAWYGSGGWNRSGWGVWIGR